MAKGFRDPMTWLHTWSGLIVGWLLFAIFVTGTSAYYKNEITLWMQPEVHKSITSDKSFDIAIEKALSASQKADTVSVSLPSARSNVISVRAQINSNNKQAHAPQKTQEKSGNSTVKNKDKKQNKNRRRRTPPTYYDASTGEIIVPRETAGGNFLYRFHFELYSIPRSIGRLVVALATMVMLVAIITGIIIHARIFKDIFTFRSKNNTRGWMDAHILPAVAVLPFLIMITYSGLLLFNNVLMPWGMKTYYGNDFRAYRNEMNLLRVNNKKPIDANEVMIKNKQQRKMSHPHRSEKVSNNVLSKEQLLQVIKNANNYWPNNIGGFTITKEKRNKIEIEVVPRDATSIFNVKFQKESMLFDAKTGKEIYLTTQPMTTSAIVDTNTAFISLHMAHFADSTLRFVFFVCGIFGVIISGTGLILWIQKRKKKDQFKKSFGFWLVDKLNVGTISGLMIALSVYFIANRFIPMDVVMRKELEINVFFIAWLISYIHGFIRNTSKAWIEQFILGAVLFISLPILNAILLFDNITEFYTRDSIFIYFDIFFIFMASAFSLITFILIRKSKNKVVR